MASHQIGTSKAHGYCLSSVGEDRVIVTYVV